MSEKKAALELDFDELMEIYFSVDMPLRDKALQTAIELGDTWEQFDGYLPRIFPADCVVDENRFFRAALKFADTYQRCCEICRWATEKVVAEEAAEKMAKFAHAIQEWEEVELYAKTGSDLEALATKKLAELSASQTKT